MRILLAMNLFFLIHEGSLFAMEVSRAARHVYFRKESNQLQRCVESLKTYADVELCALINVVTSSIAGIQHPFAVLTSYVMAQAVEDRVQLAHEIDIESKEKLSSIDIDALLKKRLIPSLCVAAGFIGIDILLTSVGAPFVLNGEVPALIFFLNQVVHHLADDAGLYRGSVWQMHRLRRLHAKTQYLKHKVKNVKQLEENEKEMIAYLKRIKPLIKRLNPGQVASVENLSRVVVLTRGSDSDDGGAGVGAFFPEGVDSEDLFGDVDGMAGLTIDVLAAAACARPPTPEVVAGAESTRPSTPHVVVAAMAIPEVGAPAMLETSEGPADDVAGVFAAYQTPEGREDEDPVEGRAGPNVYSAPYSSDEEA